MIKNYRELASLVKNKNGYIIKPKSIFRSGELNKLCHFEKEDFARVGIRKIYDLRSKAEVEVRPTLLDINIVNYNVTNTDSNVQMDKKFLESIAESGSDDFMITLYRDYLPFSPILKPLFKDVIKQRNTFLFHCAAGKDRTGITGALIMYLLDFDLDDIVEEYIKLDYRVLVDAEEGLKNNHDLSDEVIKKLEPLNTVKASFIKAFFESIIKKYKSIDNYISTHLELKQEEISAFKEAFMIN